MATENKVSSFTLYGTRVLVHRESGSSSISGELFVGRIVATLKSGGIIQAGDRYYTGSRWHSQKELDGTRSAPEVPFDRDSLIEVLGNEGRA